LSPSLQHNTDEIYFGSDALNNQNDSSIVIRKRSGMAFFEGMVLGGKQAASLGLVFGVKAFSTGGGAFLNIEPAVLALIKAELGLHLRSLIAQEILANPGHRTVAAAAARPVVCKKQKVTTGHNK
jgi:hypothetical protein